MCNLYTTYIYIYKNILGLKHFESSSQVTTLMLWLLLILPMNIFQGGRTNSPLGASVRQEKEPREGICLLFLWKGKQSGYTLQFCTPGITGDAEMQIICKMYADTRNYVGSIKEYMVLIWGNKTKHKGAKQMREAWVSLPCQIICYCFLPTGLH